MPQLLFHYTNFDTDNTISMDFTHTQTGVIADIIWNTASSFFIFGFHYNNSFIFAMPLSLRVKTEKLSCRRAQCFSHMPEGVRGRDGARVPDNAFARYGICFADWYYLATYISSWRHKADYWSIYREQFIHRLQLTIRFNTHHLRGCVATCRNIFALIGGVYWVRLGLSGYHAPRPLLPLDGNIFAYRRASLPSRPLELPLRR